MFTNVEQILTELKQTIQNSISGYSVYVDEPIDLVYDDLPSINIYPIREDFIYEESFSQDKKQLAVRIEVRLKGSPASSVASPLINQIASLIRADRSLSGMVDYIELQSIQWGNDRVEKGLVCGASLDIQINYLLS